jgi:hypothetical protein
VIVTIAGRVWTLEAFPHESRGTWIAAVGAGARPCRWSRVGDWFDSEAEAIGAVVGGLAVLAMQQGEQPLRLAA